jgi:outer membrane protein assembly factor BamB/outer membrane protein OmpA-like peptidoglycan-associated protein
MGNFYLTGNNDEIAPESSALNWSFKAPKYITYAVSANLKVYVSSTDGYLYALNEATGRIKWDFNTGSPILTMPVISEGKVITSSGRKLFCLDEKNGNIIWARFDPNYYTQLGTPIIWNGKVMYAARKAFYARNLNNGRIIWVNRELQTYGASPVLYDNKIIATSKSYSGGNSTYINVLDAATGTILWKKKLSHDPNSFTPLIKDGIIYTASKNYMYAFKLNSGEVIFTKKFKHNFGSEVKYSNQSLYVSSTNGYIYKLDPENGSLQKKIRHMSKDGTKFIVVGNSIYTTTDKGELYCISAGRIKWKFNATEKRRGKILCAANGRAYYSVSNRLYSISGGALPAGSGEDTTPPTLIRTSRAGSSLSPPGRYAYRPYRRYGRNYSRYSPPYRRNYIPPSSPRYAYNNNNSLIPPESRRERESSSDTPGISTERNALNTPQSERTGDIVPPLIPVKKPRKKIVSGVVTDGRTGTPLRARIVATPRNDPQGQRRIVYNTGPGGAYSLKIPDEDYEITFSAPGYSFTTLPSKKGKKWKNKKIPLLRLETGTSFVLNNIFFDVNMASLKAASIKELRRAVGLLRQNPSLKVEVRGHTDSTGDLSYNIKFSAKRAEVVRNFLIKHGISPARLKVKGFGPSVPIADNNTPAGRAKNRRVEFYIISN